MRKKVIIIGASGHGKVVADIIQKSGDILLGFLDDNKSLPDQLSGIPKLYIWLICDAWILYLG